MYVNVWKFSDLSETLSNDAGGLLDLSLWINFATSNL